MSPVPAIGPNGGPASRPVPAPVPARGRGWRDVALAVASGLCLSAAFPTLELAPLAWVGLVPVLIAIRGRSVRAAFGLGWLTGLTFFVATCYWIVYTIGHYTDLPVPLAAILLVMMSSVLAVYHGAFTAGLRWLERRELPAVWIAPALWVTLEWMRGWFFIGFPWAGLGYSQYRFHDLTQLAEVTGVYGVSAVLVLFNVVVEAVLRERGAGVVRRLPALVTLTVLLVVLPAAGRWRLAVLAARPTVGTMRVGITQGNVQQDRKWDPSFQTETMRRYRELTLAAVAHGAQLVVWPETAAPFFFQEDGPLRDEMLAIARDAGVPVLFGTPAFRQDPRGRIVQLNRAVLLEADGSEGGTYDKMQLVPFGEYVPFGSILFFVDQMVTAVGQLGAGTVPTVFGEPGGRFGGLICYEGIFPGLSRLFVRDGADFLVNVTNDAWYGRTAAPRQHLLQGTFRAIENRVPIVRAANTGISAIIGADGRIVWEGPLFEQLWYVDEVSWTGTRTFYTRFGDVFVWSCAAVTVAALLAGFAARRRPTRS